MTDTHPGPHDGVPPPVVVANLPARPDVGTTDWRPRGKCSNDEQPDRWVDLPSLRVRGKNNPYYFDHLAALAAICASCPVKANCLWDALDNDVNGVWAGTDEYERADLREALGLPDPAPVSHVGTDEALTAHAAARFLAHRLARHGLSNKEIAQRLGVTPMSAGRLLDDRDQPALRKTRASQSA